MNDSTKATATDSSPTQPAAPRSHLGRNILLFLLGMLAVLVAVVLALPTILSTSVARQTVLAALNGQLPVRITMDSWRLSWTGPVTIENLAVNHAAAEVEISRINIANGLIPALFSRKDFGAINIDTPVVTLHPPPAILPGQTNASPSDILPTSASPTTPAQQTQTPQQTQTARPGQSAASPSTPPARITLQIAALLKINHAVVRLLTEDGAMRDLVTDATLSLDIRDLNKPAPFELNVAQPGGGKAALSGSLSILKDGIFDPQSISASLVLNASRLDLAAVSTMLLPAANAPGFAGTLNASVTAAIAGVNDVQAKGSIDLANVRFWGVPALNGDKPTLATVAMEGTFKKSAEELRFDKVVLTSPILKANIGGALASQQNGDLPAGNVVMNAELDLAALAAQLPATLHLRQNLVMQRGSLRASAQVKSDGTTAKCSAGLDLRDILATLDGRKTTLDNPITADLAATVSKETIVVENATIKASFAELNAAGTATDAHADLAVDLRKTVEEAGKFVDLAGLSAVGALHARLNARKTDTNIWALDTSVDLANTSLTGLSNLNVRGLSADLTGTTAIALSPDRKPARLSNVAWAVHSLGTRASLKAAEINLPPNAMPETPSLSLQFSTDGASIAQLATALGQTNVPALSGNITANIAGSLRAGRFTAPDANIKLTAFQFTAGPKQTATQDAFIVFGLEADTRTRSLTIAPLRAQALASRFDVPSASVADWAAPINKSELEAHAAIPLKEFIKSLGSFAAIPADTSIGGQANIDLHASAQPNGQLAQLGLSVTNLLISKSGKPDVSESRISLDVNAGVDPKAQRINISAIRLASQMLSLSASGSLARAQTPATLHAQGDIRPDFELIGKTLAAFLEQDLVMQGRTPLPFRIQCPIGAAGFEQFLASANGKADLTLDKLHTFGVDAQSLKGEINLAPGVLSLSAATDINRGRANLRLKTASTKQGPTILTIPEPYAILTGVDITQEIASDLLAKINPVFRDCAILGGMLDLSMQELMLPLISNGVQRMTLRSTAKLSGVRLAPAGMLGKLIALTSIKTQEVVIPDQEITLECKDGRAYPGPLTIPVNDVALTLTGSVGFDGMLDYTAKMPVPKGVVSADIYKYIQNATITIPITGPATNPTVSRQAFEATLADLLKEAGKNIAKEKAGELLKDVLKSGAEKQTGQSGASPTDLLKDVLKSGLDKQPPATPDTAPADARKETGTKTDTPAPPPAQPENKTADVIKGVLQQLAPPAASKPETDGARQPEPVTPPTQTNTTGQAPASPENKTTDLLKGILKQLPPPGNTKQDQGKTKQAPGKSKNDPLNDVLQGLGF